MKTFYTERDIEEMHAAGRLEIAISDEVILTDLARERALALGLTLTSGPQAPLPAKAKVAEQPQPVDLANQMDLVAQIKGRVVARLGTNSYDVLLDQIIPQVLAHLSNDMSSSPQQDGY